MFLICHVTACLKGYVNLWVEAPHGSHHLSVFGVWSGVSEDKSI